MAAANPPANIAKNELPDGEVKKIQPLYDVETEEFKDRQETVGFIRICRNVDKYQYPRAYW